MNTFDYFYIKNDAFCTLDYFMIVTVSEKNKLKE